MSEKEDFLLRVMSLVRGEPERAMLLQTHTQLYGPLSEEAGAKIRALLSAERTSAHE